MTHHDDFHRGKAHEANHHSMHCFRQAIMKHATRICLLLLLLPCLALADSPLFNSHFTDLSGQPVSMSSLRGKVTLVNFWATWCPPCRQEMPMLDKLSQEWRDQGISVVGIALDDAPAVRIFISQRKIHYRVWMGDDGTMDLLPQLGNQAIVLPFTLLLDARGNKIASWTGQLSEPLLRKALAPYLKRPAGP
jgi:thiol-disulfide isomerase/thioredoxin